MRKIFLAFILVFSLARLSFAADDRKLYDFAASLYDSGNYFGAVLEYQRFISYYPSSPLAEDALFMSGMGYLKGAQRGDAVRTFDAFISKYPDSLKSPKALERIAESYFGEGKYEAGIAKLDGYKAGKFSGESDYLIGWGYLSARKLAESESVFYYLSTKESEYRGSSAGLSSDLKLRKDIPLKSPIISGLLSAVLPGSGQAYCERYYDGLVSFFLNAAFLYLVSESNRTGNSATGLFFSVIELGWYTGNVYGAVRAADRYNNEKTDEFIKGLKIKYGFEF